MTDDIKEAPIPGSFKKPENILDEPQANVAIPAPVKEVIVKYDKKRWTCPICNSEMAATAKGRHLDTHKKEGDAIVKVNLPPEPEIKKKEKQEIGLEVENKMIMGLIAVGFLIVGGITALALYSRKKPAVTSPIAAKQPEKAELYPDIKAPM